MRRSFTLIELLISIGLMFILFLFLYKTLDGSKTTKQFLSDKVVEQKQKERAAKILFLDLYSSTNVTKTSVDESLDELNISTTHSLYDDPSSMVSYSVKDEMLMRIEGEWEDNITHANLFRLYISAKGYLVYIDGDYFEVRR